MTFGEQLRQARLAHKISQDELASLCGVTQGAIAGLERGKNAVPTFWLGKKLERELGVVFLSPDYAYSSKNEISEKNIPLESKEPA